ncbi:MAG TPA: 30S ribosomal protein S8 [Polyangiaceae bacterium]|nr:MAG: 30S ribosomal protein S8 [Deltaproteobacteria bacterium ADurb.Bin207]HNS95432.1 30S ribosomal protein S8 [Polyangiaceae bacterium]HNZ20628.1 30S ribosomal protein S8 [Polyangiaceae bacterium]HOD20756.1 30S ribosomal protein S8 [Polyangiaceae bacterium]HOE47176.1 30S ribosomal protein S8 [Polyangiaceae bacterium]
MMTDPIADMLSRIRNAALARHDRVSMPISKVKRAVADLLKQEGYVRDVTISESDGKKSPTLTVVLKYGQDRTCAIDGLKRVSTPGRRVYVRHDSIPLVQNGLGVGILSTSRGVMTDRDARRQGIGGELLCEVW